MRAWLGIGFILLADFKHLIGLPSTIRPGRNSGGGDFRSLEKFSPKMPGYNHAWSIVKNNSDTHIRLCIQFKGLFHRACCCRRLHYTCIVTLASAGCQIFTRAGTAIPCVCVCVCVTMCFLSKRLNVSLKYFYHLIAHRSSFFCHRGSLFNSDRFTPTGGTEYKGRWQNWAIFD